MCTNEKERSVELQRAARIAKNEIQWEAARCRDAAEKAGADRVTTAEMTEIAELPSNIPSLSGICKVHNIDDEAILHYSSSSVSQVSEPPTSKE